MRARQNGYTDFDDDKQSIDGYLTRAEYIYSEPVKTKLFNKAPQPQFHRHNPAPSIAPSVAASSHRFYSSNQSVYSGVTSNTYQSVNTR